MNRFLAALAAAGAALILAAAGSAAVDNSYTLHPLVSNQPALAPVVDPHLVNAWGLTAGPTTPFWVADNGADVSTLYSGTGAIAPVVVPTGKAPTGTVFNGTTGFAVTATSGAARFIFDTEGGLITAWTPMPGVPASHPATVEVTQAGALITNRRTLAQLPRLD
jgi:hypothetical protein